MIRAVALALALAGCGGPLSLLPGPNVAANVQAAQTATQTIGTTAITAPRMDRPQARRITQSADTNRLRAERIERVTVNELPAWVALLLLGGWLLPTPGAMGRAVARRIGWL